MLPRREVLTYASHRRYIDGGNSQYSISSEECATKFSIWPWAIRYVIAGRAGQNRRFSRTGFQFKSLRFGTAKCPFRNALDSASSYARELDRAGQSRGFRGTSYGFPNFGAFLARRINVPTPTPISGASRSISDTDLRLARGRRTSCVTGRDSRRNGSQIRTTKSRSGPFSGNSVRMPRSIVTSFPFLCIANPNKYASVTC